MPENLNHSLTILLAEDDIDDQELLQEALFSIAPTVRLISFSSGIKFINQLENVDAAGIPQLIVLDYNIPELNGAEILQRLNTIERFNEIVKIIWSTSDSPLYRRNCLALGAKDYLLKPSSIAGMKEVAQKMLAFCKEDLNKNNSD